MCEQKCQVDGIVRGIGDRQIAPLGKFLNADEDAPLIGPNRSAASSAIAAAVVAAPMPPRSTDGSAIVCFVAAIDDDEQRKDQGDSGPTHALRSR